MKHIVCDKCGVDTKQSDPQVYFTGPGFDTMLIRAKDDDVHYCRLCLAGVLLAIGLDLLRSETKRDWTSARRLLEELGATLNETSSRHPVP